MRKPKTILNDFIRPGLALLPPALSQFEKATYVLLLTTTLQEANGEEQKQLPRVAGGTAGPARGIFQFEKNGGLKGVMFHQATKDMAQAVCEKLGVPFDITSIYEALETTDDRLDVALARLLYWADSKPLPAFGDVQGAWDYYLRNWRPGAYANGTDKQKADLRKKWNVSYATAMETVQ